MPTSNSSSSKSLPCMGWERGDEIFFKKKGRETEKEIRDEERRSRQRNWGKKETRDRKKNRPRIFEVEHVTFARSIPCVFVYASTQHCCYPHRLSDPTMSDNKIYECVCSRCYNHSKSFTMRTIGNHLRRDREALESLSAPNADLANFLQSRIDHTTQLLSHIHGDHSMPDPVSDLDGSHRMDSERTFLYCLKIILSNYYFLIKSRT